MAEDQLQQHLDKGRYGAPLVKPEEQHKYMGTFRERCYLSMTIAEMKKKTNQEKLVLELDKHQDVTILLNGQLPATLQGEYIQLATKHQAKFTIVNDVDNKPDSFGLLLTAKEAVNEPEIDVEKKYPEEPVKETEPEDPDKESFWKKLFH
ncbi:MULTISPECIES: YueI family protein [Enterococcus]|uniref:YueI family protein n=1 Tax=Enterococcus TaxID=1350 RepID=UPI00065E6245|nr:MULTISPECIES: YueI family protein [Enterococcus]KAF1300892.1 hypothetical protein BAU16_10955 [Enterococcus sp. JM9B]